MAISVGVNTFVTLVEANTYAAAREGNDKWYGMEDADKEQTLVSATDWLNTLYWVGVISGDSQALAWPRTGSYWDPKYGRVMELSSNTVPDVIKTAQIEMAIDIGDNGGLTVYEGNSSPDSVSVGSISLSGLNGSSSSSSGGYILGRVEVSPIVYNSISYLLLENNSAVGSKRSVWRAW